MLHANNITHLHTITGGPPALSGREAKPKLLDQLREALRSRHYSRRTEQTYCRWVKRVIYFHDVRHPCEMAEPEINAFLTHLAVKEKVSASTQNQALSALLFLYRHVIGRGIGDLGEVIRARKPTRLPVVMTPTLRRNGAGNGSSPRKTEGYEVSLEKRKIYVAFTDDAAEPHGLVRIVDESGEDYLYPSKLFAQVELPPRVHRAVLKAA